VINSSRHGDILFSTIRHGREQLTHSPLIQQRLDLLATPSATASINAAFIFNRIPPSTESTEGDQFQLARRTERYYFPQSATADSNFPFHPSSNRGSTFSPTPPPRPQPLPPFPATTLHLSNQPRTINSSRHGEILFPAHHPTDLATTPTTTLEAPNKYHYPCCCRNLVL